MIVSSASAGIMMHLASWSHNSVARYKNVGVILDENLSLNPVWPHEYTVLLMQMRKGRFIKKKSVKHAFIETTQFAEVTGSSKCSTMTSYENQNETLLPSFFYQITIKAYHNT